MTATLGQLDNLGNALPGAIADFLSKFHGNYILQVCPEDEPESIKYDCITLI